jgi:hypothetical protein
LIKKLEDLGWLLRGCLQGIGLLAVLGGFRKNIYVVSVCMT